MSRTDKTKPWRVRVAEHNPRAEHDHADGICDLPDDPRDLKWRGCHWSDFNLIHAGCCWGCGCERCTDQADRKAKRKRERKEAKRKNAREITLGEERYGTVDGRRHGKRKDTSLWCKGKIGRRHISEVRWANWADFVRAKGRTCYEDHRGLDGWRRGWHCYHEVGCSVCGKILEHAASRELCPTWLAQQ